MGRIRTPSGTYDPVTGAFTNRITGETSLGPIERPVGAEAREKLGKKKKKKPTINVNAQRQMEQIGS